jgi:hypothetical protein
MHVRLDGGDDFDDSIPVGKKGKAATKLAKRLLAEKESLAKSQQRLNRFGSVEEVYTSRLRLSERAEVVDGELNWDDLKIVGTCQELVRSLNFQFFFEILCREVFHFSIFRTSASFD